jgi:transcriptional regulator with XRE-family HTH domain
MKNKDDKALTNFGKNLRHIRKMQNLSQEELAEKVGLHRTYIGMVERGEKNITLLNIMKLSNALEISISELMEFK